MTVSDKQFDDDYFRNMHNQLAYLDEEDKSIAEFKELIKNLKRSKIATAISINPKTNKRHIRQFWKNAKLDPKNEELIQTEVDGLKITVTEEIVRKVLKFGDKEDDPRLLKEDVIKKCCLKMMYQGPFPTLFKGMFPWQWKYLPHVILQSLSSRKAGTDTLNASYASLMIALVLNLPFNFSRLIFVGMRENCIKGSDDRFMLFPRFIEAIILDQHPNIEFSGDDYVIQPMDAKTVKNTKKNFKNKYDEKKSKDLKLFGFFAGDDEFSLGIEDEDIVVEEREVVDLDKSEKVAEIMKLKKERVVEAEA